MSWENPHADADAKTSNGRTRGAARAGLGGSIDTVRGGDQRIAVLAHREQDGIGVEVDPDLARDDTEAAQKGPVTSPQPRRQVAAARVRRMIRVRFPSRRSEAIFLPRCFSSPMMPRISSWSWKAMPQASAKAASFCAAAHS